MSVYEKLICCTEQMQSKISCQPKVGIVLGSGLGALADAVTDPIAVAYEEIDHFPTSTAPGHAGRFVFGELEGVPVVMMQGRVHLYEGYPVADCVLPVRLMGLLGVEALILTNAAGAVNEGYRVGDFCIIKDHISTMVPSPLLGPNLEDLGPRFPDMTEVYHPKIREWIHEAAEQAECTVHDGVYMQFTGPQYETPQEIRMARMMGADMVGMSTVVEAIAAHHMGIPLAAISLVTNQAAGLGGKLSEQEVLEEGKKAAERFQRMIRLLIGRWRP